MSPKRFKDWQERMGWSAAEVAKRLGKSPDTISAYRISGVPKAQALVVGLAMAALENRLEPV
jgi:transcriptional regulator with XRE-family HTH domain